MKNNRKADAKHGVDQQVYVIFSAYVEGHPTIHPRLQLGCLGCLLHQLNVAFEALGLNIRIFSLK